MSVTAPTGFTAHGVACGIKPTGDLDLSLVATADGIPVAAAAVFTQNRLTAAPVVTTAAHLARTGGRAAAVVLNSGCANAATGLQGAQDAEETTALVAKELGCAADEVLVCSTGLIGHRLPMDAVRGGIGPLVAGRGDDEAAGHRAAEAIMTTDTRAKEVLVPRDGFTVGGMAKGAAMLAPNMATMLAVLTTDAAVAPDQLTELLRRAVADSFNAITVDGCTSTNDTVIVLASGAAGEVDERDLEGALSEACLDLARQMVGDAEGHTKVVTVEVVGALSDEEARAGARKVAESQLVKCSWYGNDPYWGRVASELGTAGITVEADKLSIRYGDHVVARNGVTAEVDEAALAAYMAGAELHVVANLGIGDGRARLLTNDLTHAYIDENMGTS